MALAAPLHAPASGAVGLGGREAEDRLRREFVDVPGWRTGARGTELVGERPVLDRWAPVAEGLCYLLQLRVVRHDGGLTFDHEINPSGGERDRASWVVGEVGGLLGARSGSEIEPSFVPDRTYRNDVRFAIRAARGQPIRMRLPISAGSLLHPLARQGSHRPIPRDRLPAVSIMILRLSL